MEEANNNKYFLDGFFIKHLGIWPLGCDKNNLFYEQKIFIMYLMGAIPDYENWELNVDYMNKLEKIKKMDNIELDKTEIDIAKMQGKNIKLLKKEKLTSEKKKKIKELNEYFKVKDKEEEKEEIKFDAPKQKNSQEELWKLLHGKK